MSRYTFEEQTDMHLMHGFAKGNVNLAIEMYKTRFPRTRWPHPTFLINLHKRLKQMGKFSSNVSSEPIILEVAIPKYRCEEKRDMHFMYGRADSNPNHAREMYRRRYPGRHLPTSETFSLMDILLREHGRFHPLINSGEIPTEEMISNFTFVELTNFHLMYGLAEGEGNKALEQYKICFPKGRRPKPTTFETYHRNLMDFGKFSFDISSEPIILDVAMPDYTREEKRDMHFIYGCAHKNPNHAREMYQQRYPHRHLPTSETFSLMHKLLRKYGRFHPLINKDERPRKVLRMPNFTFEEQTDLHLMYGLAEGDGKKALDMYRACFLRRICAEPKTLETYHKNLNDVGKFTLCSISSEPIILDGAIPNCTCVEKRDMHFIYGRNHRNPNYAREMYGQRYPDRPLPASETFSLMDKLLREYGRFHPLINNDDIPTEVIMPNLTFEEQTDLHLMYGLAESNGKRALEMYKSCFHRERCPGPTTLVAYHRNLMEIGKFGIYISSEPIILHVAIPDYTCEEKRDMHFIYGCAHRNPTFAREMYQQRYPTRRLPASETFLLIDKLLRDYGRFHPLINNYNVPSSSGAWHSQKFQRQ